MAGEKQQSNNPFLSTLHQRSHSHQRIAALMRVGSTLPLSPARNTPLENLPTTTGVVQMRREDLPLGWTVPLSRIQVVAAAPTLTSFNKIPPPLQESTRITPAQASDAPHQEPAQPLSSSVQSPSTPPDIIYPSSQPIQEYGLEDEWPRLEAIFERHEEAEQQSDEIENAMPAEEEEKQLGEELTPPKISSSEERVIESEMTALQPDNEIEKYAEHIPPASPQFHAPQAVIQKQPDNDRTPETPQEVKKNDQIMEAPSSIEKTTPFNRPEIVEEDQEQSSPSKMKPANELQIEEDTTQKRSASESLVVEEESEVGAVLEQAVPLNAIWPVEQRVISPADYSSSAPTLTTPSQDAFQEISIQTEQFDQAEKAVHSALENVPGEHPSRSSMEVITPRYSRPVIQRQNAQIEERPVEEQMLNDETYSDSQSNASIPSLQTDLIETDIGPLPAVLWKLLDQPLPSETNEKISQPKITQTQSEDKFAQLEEAIASAEKNNPPIDHTSTPASQQPTVIQRTEDHRSSTALPETPQNLSSVPQNSVQRSVQPASTDSPDANERAQENGEKEKGFDLESISRKVYAEIKRRLRREHERDR